MTLTAALPRVRRGDLWRIESRDRLRVARFEETRRVDQVTDRRIVCAIESTDPSATSGRTEYTREWNLLSRPGQSVPGDPPDEANRWRWQPHYPQFSFPLAAGKQWLGTATVANRATATRNVHRYRARVLTATEVAVPGGRFAVLPVRFESDVGSDDGQAQLAWRNVETLFYAPKVNFFVRYEQRITGPDGQPARDMLLELLLYQPAR